ncbi:MAG: hypothetical protein ABSG31_09490 [Tepidisphaeraceae bacterium]|jgi:hypothetical protein
MFKTTIAIGVAAAILVLSAIPTSAQVVTSTKKLAKHPTHHLIHHKKLVHRKKLVHKKTAAHSLSHVKKTTASASEHPLVHVTKMPPMIDDIHT